MQDVMILTEFTPIASLLGGALIGLAAVGLMLLHGRVMGATGILSGVFFPISSSEWVWRVAVVAGMLCGPVIYLGLTGGFPAIDAPSSRWALILGGVIVGLGVTYGSGCTSGHGVCGNARLSPRSLAATLTFMLTTGITVYVIRHVISGEA
ncbi:YeeE/YedE family protein [Cochlodiniinecator piscidefendens]|uniref:YeeE/YedE family protein n=1 Tax=Cochlodiniinecator piscidefendens TaxID=2715756 RepID=UPI001408D96E|nr:YeeE/YedE family protein [Cochlodiniinecator piscidefendens]